MRIKPLSEHVGAEIGGVNLAADLSYNTLSRTPIAMRLARINGAVWALINHVTR